MAHVGSGDLHQARQVFWFHTVRRQAACDAHAHLELLEPGYKTLAAADNFANVREFVKFLRGSFVIPCHHGVDHQGIGQAVVQVTYRAQRVGARVNGTQIFLEGNSAHHRGHHHVRPRLQIARLFYRRQQSRSGDARAFQGDAVTQRVVGGREVTFDVVGERVHAGSRCHVRGQAQCQLRVGKYTLSQNFGAEHDALEVRIVFTHHAAAAYFRAGARGRGQGHKIRQLVGDGPHVRVIPHVFQNVAFMCGRHAHHFGYVQRRTTAKADHTVRLVRLVGRCTIHHLAARGVAKHTAVNGHVQPRQMGFELRQNRQCAQGFVGDDKRPLEAVFKQMRGNEFARACAEFDGGGE